MTKYKSAEELAKIIDDLYIKEFIPEALHSGIREERLLWLLRPHLKTGEVIDVEGAAGKIEDKYCSNYVFTDPIHKALRAESIAAIIRKYRKPIEVVWKDGIEDGQHLALWGESFELEVYSVELKDSQIEWYWQITFLPRANGQTGINESVDRFPTQQTAQSACLEALNRIINGQKEE